jgi:NADH-quinone oxidoreductase subunit C
MKNLVAELQNLLPKITQVVEQHGQIVIGVQVKYLTKVLQELKENPNFLLRQLVDLTAVDYPNRDKRFDVVYHLLSHKKNFRVAVKIQIEENQKVPTSTEIFKSADWYEREVYDMFGICFANHPNLKRILTDYNFKGYPLRKDFPTEGEKDMFYDEDSEKCQYTDSVILK